MNKNELNILLLGETGVGKSTFINAFANYLSFSTLEEAKNSEIVCLIPSKFTIYDENFNEISIEVSSKNNDTNENTKNDGQSATQFPKSHVLSYEGKDFKLRLIDTPGIGDIRGIDKDKENFQNLLAYIANYEHLNAIIILLKPNNSRLGVAFPYYLKELLSYLHKDAANNIVFCFTNSRGTFYRPGDTSPILRELLEKIRSTSGVDVPFSKDNTFCFDNESFRFLAALKSKPDAFTEEEKIDFASSWNTSVVVATNMLEHILKLEKHMVKDTTTLNEARNMIQELSKPLAEISQNIQLNIKIAEETIEKMKHLVQQNAIDKNVQEQLNNAKSNKEKISIQKNAIEKRIRDLRKEQDKIVEISAKFAHFTKQNAILAFNDDIDKYLDLCIQEEENKCSIDPTHEQILAGLRETKKKYSEQKAIFEKVSDIFTSSSDAKAITTNEVKNLVNELFQLPINGPNLEKLIKGIHAAKKRNLEFHENYHQINPKIKGKSSVNALISFFTKGYLKMIGISMVKY
jgi:GTPase SAR1 family protein